MARFDHSGFERLARETIADVVPTSERAFDLVLDNDMCLKVMLHPDEQQVVGMLFVADIAILSGPVREAVVRALLGLNDATQGGRAIACGLDSRSFLTMRGLATLAELDGTGLAPFIDYLVWQGERVRALIRALSFHGESIEFEFDAGAGATT